MTESGSTRRLRSHRVALAAAGTGAAIIAAATVMATTQTIAGFADSVWAGAGFSAGSFGIESSLNQGGPYENHSGSPLTLNFGTPITLAPGEVSYAGLYIRRAPGVDDYADVTVSGPTGESESSTALWNDHLTFVAKFAPVAGTGADCDAEINENPYWEPLYNSSAFGNPVPEPGGTFTLGESVPGLPAGEPYMVCFEFTLDEDVVTEAPEANGESVHPTWTFTAESRQP